MQSSRAFFSSLEFIQGASQIHKDSVDVGWKFPYGFAAKEKNSWMFNLLTLIQKESLSTTLWCQSLKVVPEI